MKKENFNSQLRIRWVAFTKGHLLHIFCQFKSDFVLAQTVGSFCSHSGTWNDSQYQAAGTWSCSWCGIVCLRQNSRGRGAPPLLYPRTSPLSQHPGDAYPVPLPRPGKPLPNVFTALNPQLLILALTANIINWSKERMRDFLKLEKKCASLEFSEKWGHSGNFTQGLSVPRLRGLHQTETVS